MKKSMIQCTVAIFLFWSYAALAQLASTGSVWIQLEAQPDRPSAMQSIERYMRDFGNVVGFNIGAGWFGVALGPYEEDAVEAVWQEFHRSGLIPRTSFITTGTSYRSQIPLPTVAQDDPAQPTSPEMLSVAMVPVGTIATSELSRAKQRDKALETEQAMNISEKKYLQRALAWVGFYESAIDGLYGRATRSAMSLWQISNGYDETGVLTTLQRDELISNYTRLLAGLDFIQTIETKAGISIQVPNAILGAPKYDEPFVRFEANDGSVIKVILISQTGDEARLKALYQVIQTLSIIPKNGARKLNKSNFTIEAFNSELHTTGFAQLRDGHIKGALLVWPVGDDARRERVADEIFNSFNTLPGALADATIFENGFIPKDLLSGLGIRQPKFVQSGVFLNATGMILTAARDFGSCDLIELGDGVNAQVVIENAHLAVLEALQDITPAIVPEFQSLPLLAPRRISIGGYSYSGQLSMPTVTLGILQDVKNLEGERDIARLEINTLPGDIGGPLYDQNGAVVGVLLPNPKTVDRQLPSNVKFAATWGMISPLLQQENVPVASAVSSVLMDAIDLSNIAKNTVALIKCWD
jgi:peptidoglycan hydrolase-like protein with peptidoglycan-binding domain